jgi:hypothetical protein
MAATQARTERQISELLRRPGNEVCADCSSPSVRRSFAFAGRSSLLDDGRRPRADHWLCFNGHLVVSSRAGARGIWASFSALPALPSTARWARTSPASRASRSSACRLLQQRNCLGQSPHEGTLADLALSLIWSNVPRSSSHAVRLRRPLRCSCVAATCLPARSTFTREQIDALSKGGNLAGNALRNNDDRANPPPTNLEMEGRDNELERCV